MADTVRPTGMTKERIDTREIRNLWITCEYLPMPHVQVIRDLCDEIDILRGELASAEFTIRRRECLDALKAAIEQARQTEGHAHG